MIIGATAKRPMIFALRFLNWKIIDARESQPHQAIVVELPILVAIRAIPISRIVVPLVGEPHGDAVIRERPQFLDQAVVQPSSARRTFWIAVSRVNGGSGGLVVMTSPVNESS